MVHYVIFIVNKNGQLMFYRPLSSDSAGMFDADRALRLASTFHTMHSISSQICPKPLSDRPKAIAGSHLLDGIDAVYADTFKLKALQTLTGIKMFIVSSWDEEEFEMEEFLKEVYVYYSDYWQKNPFSQEDQPIKSDKFREALQEKIDNM